MNFLGNILWLVLGGLLVSLIYYFMGLLMCITIIGIPFGIQLFKLGHAAFQDGDWLHFSVREENSVDMASSYLHPGP